MRSLHLSTVIAGVAVALGSVTACGSNDSAGSGPGESGTITIGLVSAFSGSAAAWGPMQKAADDIAIKQINDAGGIKVGGKTYTLRLKTYDSAYDPTQAVTAVRQAVQQDGVKFLNVLGGGVVPAVEPITEPAKALIFANAGGDDYLGKTHPYTFRPYYDIPASFNASLQYLKQKSSSISKVAILYPDDDLGHGLAGKSADYAKQAGMQVQTYFAGRDVTDFSSILTKIRSFNPDVIEVGPTPPNQYAEQLKEARQMGLKATFSFSDTIDLPTVVKVAGDKNALGNVASPTFDAFTTAEGRQFATEYKKSFGSIQGWTAQEYDNFFLLKAAMEKAGTVTDTEKIAEALGTVTVTGALGDVHYGGTETFGLPRIFILPYPVAEMTAGSDGKATAKVVYTATAK